MFDRRYRCSAAREEALSRLDRLLSGAYAANRKNIPPHVRDMTFQSAIFQASSTLEEYIKQIFDHWLYELKRQNKSAQSIPSPARFSYVGRQLSREFNNYAYSGDEKRLAKGLQDQQKIIGFTMDNSEILNHLTGEIAYKDRKYPSPKNIKILYSRIGCDNIFQILSRELKSDSELKLQGFNDVRTSIAHGNPPDLTLEDVRRNLNNIKLIIRSLDKINHREFSRNFGGGVW